MRTAFSALAVENADFISAMFAFASPPDRYLLHFMAEYGTIPRYILSEILERSVGTVAFVEESGIFAND